MRTRHRLRTRVRILRVPQATLQAERQYRRHTHDETEQPETLAPPLGGNERRNERAPRNHEDREPDPAHKADQRGWYQSGRNNKGESRSAEEDEADGEHGR